MNEPLPREDAEKLVAFDEALRAGRLGSVEEIADGDIELAASRVILQLEQRWPRAAGGSPTDAPAGAPRIGRYTVLRELGRGGFGIVFLARDEADGKFVALKVPRPEMLLNDEARKRFLTEARAIAALSHLAIVPVHEVGDAGPICYLASTFVPGPSLAEALADGQWARTPRQATVLILQLAEAVQHVHEQGLLHRDLKPSNVLLWPKAVAEECPTNDGIPFVPMLTDFGLAKFVELSMQDTQSSLLLGTPLYMAPEQAECRHTDFGAWTDVYALGAILYELLTGRPPFAGEGLVSVLNRVRTERAVPPQLLNPQAPRRLAQICLKCLEKEPADRYHTAKELSADLQRFLRGEPVRARPPGIWRRFSLWSRRPERMRDAGMFTVALNVGLILWMVGMTAGVHLVPAWNRAATADFRFQVGLAVLLLHCPQLVIGWQTIQRRWWAIVSGTCFAVTQLGIAIAAMLQGESPFTAMYPDALAMFNSFWLLTQLFVAEVACFALAIVARWYWKGAYT